MQNEDENQLRFRDFSSSTCAESRERGGLAAKKGADPLAPGEKRGTGLFS